jgi:hypothetical protein
MDYNDPPIKPQIDSDPSKERLDEPYMTFPGHHNAGYPGGMPPGPYGPPPMYGGMPQYPGYPPYYPYYPRRPIDPFGATALTLGIIAMCIFWFTIIPDVFGTLMLVVIICLGGISIIFGGYSYASRKRRSIAGLVGLIIAIVALVLSSLLWSFTHIGYY